MKRTIRIVAGFHLTATDKEYINAILDTGQTRGHRKGGKTVMVEPTTKEAEILRYKDSVLFSERARQVENYTTTGRLYGVIIVGTDKRTSHLVVDIVESA